jgi:hypothetical protein
MNKKKVYNFTELADRGPDEPGVYQLVVVDDGTGHLVADVFRHDDGFVWDGVRFVPPAPKPAPVTIPKERLSRLIRIAELATEWLNADENTNDGNRALDAMSFAVDALEARDLER